MGYCVYWLCIVERSWSQYWSAIVILSIVLISLYIFLCLNFPEIDYTRIFDGLLIICYYLAAASMYAATELSILTLSMLSLGQGEWQVNRFGWCQPKPKSQVFDFLPIPLFFIVICFLYGITLIKYWLSPENENTALSEKVFSSS
jgi:hypothetical protein